MRVFRWRTGMVCLAGLLGMAWLGAACAQGDDLQVRRISPSGEGVAPGQEAVIQFDRKMVALGDMARDKTALPVSIRPAPGCQWRWLNTSELACRLPEQQTFAPATKYVVTVGTALKALDGSHLAKPVTRTFTTLRPKVDWSDFRKWDSPLMPVFKVRLNLPVTAEQLAAHLGFSGKGRAWVPAKVEPYTEKRQGPVWLPVSGVLGAVMQIDTPNPDTPLDADATAAQGRRIWQVRPARPLAADTAYKLRVKHGLRSPLGPLAGEQSKAVAGLQTYADFAFRGVECEVGSRSVQVEAGDKGKARCAPNSLVLQFSAPLPRETLAAIRWQPQPRSGSELARIWHNYPEWFLQPRRQADAPDRADRFPLTFKLDPMQTYTLTVPAGVKDHFGRTLSEPAQVTFRTGHRVPFFDPPPTEAVLEAGQATIVPLRFTNLERLVFPRQRMFAQRLTGAPAAMDSTADATYPVPFVTPGVDEVPARGRHSLPPVLRQAWAEHLFQGDDPRVFDVENLLARPDLSAPADRIMRGRLGIREMLRGRSGVVWGDIDWAPEGPWQPRRFMGQVTPWQVLAKVGHYDTLVWVAHMGNDKPVSGAHVKWLLGQHHALGTMDAVGDEAVTDADGLAVLPGTAALPESWFHMYEDKSNFYIGAARDASMALLPLDYYFSRSIGSASHYDFSGDIKPPHGHMRAWAVTEQGIYRPGSEVAWAAFVRAEGADALQPPPSLDYTLTITDPQGNDVLEHKHAELSAYGGMHGKLDIAPNAPMGRYAITISWPTASGKERRLAGHFTVTDFVPAAFKVRAQWQSARFKPGQTAHAGVHATLHAGGPYTDAEVKFTTRLVPERFSPDTAVTAGFSFGDDRESLPDARTLASTRQRLDPSGRAKTEVALPTGSKVAYGEVRVEASVKSSRGTWVADTARVPWVASERFLGLRTSDWMQTAGKPFKVEYVVVDPDGMPQAGSDVVLQLQRKTTARVRVKNGAGDFTHEEHTEWVTEAQCKKTSGAAPSACRLTPKQAGRYRVLGRVSGKSGVVQASTLSTWVTGAGRVLWSRSDKGVTLVPDQSGYHAGDVAHVLVQNPYPGARALVTVERYGVLWKKMVTLEGSAPVIDVPIGEDFFPGAYLSVAIFSPRASAPDDPDLGRPELALGYMALKVTGKGSGLDVHVTPRHDEYKPGQTVAVDVAVQRHGKTPGKTRLVVAVVDQGVVDLLQEGKDYYDPRKRFYAPPDGPDIDNFSLVEQLLTRLQPKQGKGESPSAGGGGSTGPNVRSNFSYAAYWNADLETDAAGHARFNFKLPDNLTKWRILVVAVRPGAAMGLGDGNVRVNLPLQVEPALPNQMRVGDHFGAAFNVTNRTRHKLDVSTHVQATGAIKGGKADARHALQLDSFQHGLSWLQLTASEPGDITLTAQAKAGSLGDAVSAKVPVRGAGTEVVAAEYGSTTDSGASVPVKIPATAMAGKSNVAVTFAPTLVGGLDGAFRVMRDDPLRTWEVRLSRAVLASDYQRLKPVIGPSIAWSGSQDAIDHMLKAASAFQAPNGGMGFWIPRDKFVSKYLSVYTALAFDWLETAGHTPPARVKTRLWKYIHDHVVDGQDDKPGARTLQAGALAALAMSADDKLPDGAVTGMLPKLREMRLFGQALLLDAAVASEDRKSADKILESLFSHAEESAGQISFNEREEGAYVDFLATPLRSNCAILGAMSRYRTAYGDENLLGTTPQKLMRWVAGQRRNAGGWPNSQENVFCTTAIAHYADAYETPVKALTGQLDLPDGKPRIARFSSRAAPVVKLAGPAAEPGHDFAVKLDRGGEGRLYYGVQVHYTMPADALPAADAGMSLSRHYFVQRDHRWQPVDADTSLRRGDVVRVDLDVDVPTERHHVVLTDPLPGAFEAVNRLLATAPGTGTAPAEQPGVSVLMFDGGSWPNMSVVTGGFYHRETHFDAVRFFADDLPAGHYRVVYSAQVIAPGTFIAPTPHIKEIYQPDVFGRGTPQHLNVAMPED